MNILWDEALQEIQVSIMGVIQLQVLKDMVKERFNLDVDFGSCEILYKETILEETIGYGHFEPLKHYAEVHLKNEEEVIEKIGYNKDADIEYTFTSVFCSKGQSFLVSSKDAASYMHCNPNVK